MQCMVVHTLLCTPLNCRLSPVASPSCRACLRVAAIMAAVTACTDHSGLHGDHHRAVNCRLTSRRCALDIQLCTWERPLSRWYKTACVCKHVFITVFVGHELTITCFHAMN